MQKKLLPEFRGLFERRLGMGTYHIADRIFEVNERGQKSLFGSVSDTATQIFFGHAQDPDSLESATAKAAILDEAGQKKFRYGSWEAVERRLSIYEGRILITTTPYTLGWLKTELHDAAQRGAPDVELIQFESTMNPAFPEGEYERQRAKLPRWKFDMMYRGRFTRPAGMIYDCLEDRHFVPRFAVPPGWRRLVGLDFGGTNTAGAFLAAEQVDGQETGRYFVYRAYKAGSRTAEEHASAIVTGEPHMPYAVGGAGSETQWRREFGSGGLAVREPPIREVEVGIARVYAMIKTGRLIFFDDLKELRDDLYAYSRVLDDQGEPTEAIEDKATFHRLDALRYICADIADIEHEPITSLVF